VPILACKHAIIWACKSSLIHYARAFSLTCYSTRNRKGKLHVVFEYIPHNLLEVRTHTEPRLRAYREAWNAGASAAPYRPQDLLGQALGLPAVCGVELVSFLSNRYVKHVHRYTLFCASADSYVYLHLLQSIEILNLRIYWLMTSTL
jgi:hypothetical protein